MARIDWDEELRKPIYTDVLEELGNPFTLEVISASTRSASGKKVATEIKKYTGVAVEGGYATLAEKEDSPLIQAGDVKFVTQFDDKDFEPSEKLDETFVFGGKKYKIAHARGVTPSGDINIVWIIFARRVS